MSSPAAEGPGTADHRAAPRTAPYAARLVEAVLDLAPLLQALPAPLSVPPGDGLPDAAALERVARRLGVPPIVVGTPAAGGRAPGAETFAQVAAARLKLAGPPPEPGSTAAEGGLTDGAVDAAAARDIGRAAPPRTVKAPDGTPLRIHTTGPDAPGGPPVVLASAPGMPARLAAFWLRGLAARHRVLTVETRGLFGDPGDPGGFTEPFPGHTGLDAQADDLITAMDEAGLADAHVMGLCGGAALALAAAARHPRRVSSLSLWHGDLELGPDGPKTDHQRNLQALMGMARADPASAGLIHQGLLNAMRGSVPADIAPLALYPYADTGLFVRYSVLNGAVMDTDLRPLLPRVTAPALVVTSGDDTTAHPGGSAEVARALPGATTWTRPHGDHISVFRGAPELLARAEAFLSGPSGLAP
ncbi:alpha/beta fold hydrolase [Streptomyces sp. C10-9-1]|uniref:alpha/beta fold hydrolase n=1 Tax=Streptomyces sp. C10-9-1 TaxID=1859285 RepID=UPI003D737245